jgi:ABC-type nitrate/sulfonate/bicarbonate transport system permease component
MAEAWAGIVVATLLGATLQLVVMAAERLLIPWHPSRRLTLA